MAATDGTVSFSIETKVDAAGIDKAVEKVSSLDKLINSINKVEMTIKFSEATLASFKGIEDNIKKMSDGFEALGKDYSKAMLEGAKMARIEMETQGKLQIEKEKQKTQELIGINKAASNSIVANAIETADKINEANKKVKAPTFDLDANKAIIDLKNSFALQKQALDSGNKELYAAQSEAVQKLLDLIPESNKKSILLYRQTAALKLVESKRAMQLEIEAEAEKNKKIIAAVDEGKKIIAAKDAEAAKQKQASIKKQNDDEAKQYELFLKWIEDLGARRLANEVKLGEQRIAEAKRVEDEIKKIAEASLESQKKAQSQAGMMLGNIQNTAPKPTAFSGMPSGLQQQTQQIQAQQKATDTTGMLLGNIKAYTPVSSANQALPSGLSAMSDSQKRSLAEANKAIEDNNKRWLESVKQVSAQMEKDELYLRQVRRTSIEMERNDRLKAIKETADAQAREDRIIARQAAMNSTWMGRQGTTNQPTANPQATTSALGAVTDSLNSVHRALMAVGVVLSGRQIMEYADNWLHFVNAVGIATEKTGGAVQMQEKLFKLAQDNRAPLEAITSIYLRMSRAAETLNMTQGETVKMIDVVTKSLAIMGTSPSAVRGGLLQLEQALGGVTVRGQEFKSILDSMPNVMATVAKHYQDAAKDIKLQEASLRGASEAELDKIRSEKTHELSISALRNMMYQGEVASAAFAKAIIMGQDEIDATFEKTHKTFAQAFQTIENGFTKWVGQLNQGTEASDKFYRMAQQIADNFNIVVGVIGAATAAIATYALSFGAIAIAINPLGAAVAVIAGLTAGFALLKDEIKVTGDGLATWGDVFDVVTDRLGDSISNWMSKLSDFKDWLDKKFPNAKAIAGSAIESVDNVVQKIYDLSPTGVAGNWISEQIDSATKQAEKKAQERAYQKPLASQEQKALGGQFSSNVGFANDEQGRLNKKRYDEAKQAREDEIAQLTSIAKKQSELNNEELRRLGLSEQEQFILKEMDKDLEKQRTTIKDGTRVRFEDLESYKKHLTDIGINYDEIYRKQYAGIFAEKEAFTERKKANDEAKRWSEPEAKAQTIESMDTAIKGVRDEISTLSNELTNFSAKHPLSLSVSIDKNKALSEVAQFKDMFEKSGAKYGVSPTLLASIAVQESRGNPNAVSYAGAKSGLGLMQIGESTAQTYKLAAKDRLDPEKSIDTAAKIMADLMKTFNNDVRLALAAYNAGKGRVQGVQGDVSKLTLETRKFAPEILGRLNGESGTQSKELITLQQKLNELKEKEVKLAQARNEFDSAPSKITKKGFDLAQGSLKETEKEYKNAVQSQKEFESANKSVIEALDKQTQAAYSTAHAYDFLKERQSISLQAKTLGVEKGGFAIPEIDAMLKQITDKENELSKASAKAVAELETAKALAATAPTQANFDAEVAALNKKLALESEIANTKKQASDVSRIELDLLQQQANVIPNLKQGNIDLMESLTSSTVELEKQRAIRTAGATGEEANKIRSLIDTKETLKGLNDIKSTVTGTLSSSFSTMFSDVLTRGKSFTSAFRDMFKNMVASISQGLMNVAMQALMTGNFIVAGLAAAGSIITGLMGGLFKDKVTDTSTPDTRTTGTVRGNSDIGSNSVSNIIKTLNDIHAAEWDTLKDIANGFKNLGKSVDNTITMAVQKNGVFQGSTNAAKSISVNPLGSNAMIGANLGVSAALGASGLIAQAGLYAGAALINAGATSLGIGISTAAASSATLATSIGTSIGAGAMSNLVGGFLLGTGGGLILAVLQYGLGKLLGIGKVKYEAIGYGIVTQSTDYVLAAAGEAVDEVVLPVMNYSKIKMTVKGWFSDTIKIYDIINGLNTELTVALSRVFNNFNAVLSNLINSLGVQDIFDKAFTLPKIKLSLSKLKSDEISKKINDSVNTAMDTIVEQVSNGFITPFIKMGEGAFEALSRIGGNAAVVIGTFKNMGIEINLTGLGLISFSENMVDLYESSYKAGDGLKNFISVMNSFYKLTNTAGEQSAMSIDALVKRIADINKTSTQIKTEAGKIGITIPEIKLSTPTVGTKAETIKELKTANTSLTLQSAAAESVTTGLGKLKSTLPLNFGADYSYDDLMKMSSKWTKPLQARQADVGLLTSDTFNEVAKKLGGGTSFEKKLAETNRGVFYDAIIKLITKNESIIAERTADFKLQKAAFTSNPTTFVTSGYTNSQKELVNPFANISKEFIPQLTKDLGSVFKMTNVRQQATAYDSLITKYSAIGTAVSDLSKSVMTTQDGLTGLTDVVNSVSGVYESILAKTTTQEETQARANKTSLINLDYQTKINDAIPLVIDNVISWQKSLSDAEKASYKITDVNTVTAMSLKAFDNTIVKTSTSLESFKKSVSDWVLGKMSTTVGSPESQFTASKNIFENALALLNNPNSSAADIATTQSKITGYADTFITNIQKMYGAGDLGANMVQDVVNKVSNLGAVDYQTTMLEKTTQIADNTAKMVDMATTKYNELETANSTVSIFDPTMAGIEGANSIVSSPTTLELTSKPAANDSNTDTTAYIAELKLSNEQLAQLVVETRALVNVQVESNQTVVAQLTDLTSSSKGIEQSNRIQALAA
jgi:tape measure domain-containing protein